mmetsp:Transcript_5640/g.13537  ORF Transcript_5640/g.13537 Transcript_5640/m.13537 type:complete len:523 (-) Transcript_5640:6-1574(-)
MAQSRRKAQFLRRHRRLLCFLFPVAALCLFPFYALSRYGDSSPGLYGSRTPPEIDHSYASSRRNVRNNYYPASSCDDLFGLDSRKIQKRSWRVGDKILTRSCIVHGSLGVSACDLGTVAIALSKIWGLAHGNETVADVLGRSEKEEHLAYQKNALLILDDTKNLTSPNTSLTLAGDFRKSGPGQLLGTASLTDTILTSSRDGFSDSAKEETKSLWRHIAGFWGKLRQPSQENNVCKDWGYTYFVFRGDYVLLPKVMSTLYDVWTTDKLFTEADQSTKDCPPTIVWLDGHAYGGDLDRIYHHLFGSGVHIRRLAREDAGNETLMFKRAVFIESTSPFWEGLALYKYDHPCQNNSGLHQFRDFVLERYGVKRKELSGTTNETKRLTFLVRRNYQPHPRSDGRTDRQVEDVEGDANYLRKQYPGYQLDIVSFETMSFAEQLRCMARTDLFVAIHGAGNMHAIFLPDGAKFYEYFPPGFNGRTRFKFLSHCLGIKYESRAAVIKQKFKGGKISVSINSGSDELAAV